MTDKELLEWAAEAAGVIYKYYSEPEGLVINDDQWPLIAWNPLTDDGDALRLAVKLGLNPRPYALDGTAECGGQYEIHHHGEVQDPYAATRRAIVRAAAKIGKEMK